MPTHHRRTRCLLPIVTALVLTWSEPVWAQSKEQMTAFQQTRELKAKGKYAEAVPFAKRFIELAGKEFGETHQHYASGLNNMALLYHDQGLYAEAEPLFKRALAIRERALGPERSETAAVLGYLATLYQHQGRYADAEPPSDGPRPGIVLPNCPE